MALSLRTLKRKGPFLVFVVLLVRLFWKELEQAGGDQLVIPPPPTGEPPRDTSHHLFLRGSHRGHGHMPHARHGAAAQRATSMHEDLKRSAAAAGGVSTSKGTASPQHAVAKHAAAVQAKVARALEQHAAAVRLTAAARKEALVRVIAATKQARLQAAVAATVKAHGGAAPKAQVAVSTPKEQVGTATAQQHAAAVESAAVAWAAQAKARRVAAAQVKAGKQVRSEAAVKVLAKPPVLAQAAVAAKERRESIKVLAKPPPLQALPVTKANAGAAVKPEPSKTAAAGGPSTRADVHSESAKAKAAPLPIDELQGPYGTQFNRPPSHKVTQRTVVTSASSNHYKALIQFIKSLERTMLAHPGSVTRVLVYDLGLTPAQLAATKRCFSKFEYRTFKFESYPAHFALSEHTYAWKVAILEKVRKEFPGVILWLDAGNIADDSLTRMMDWTEANGLYSPISDGSVAKWTHPAMLKLLKVPKDMLPQRNRYGACVGFNTEFPGVGDAMQQWWACAQNKQCIAPDGSSRKNHRQDQAALTVIYYHLMAKYKFGRRDNYEDLGLRIHMDFIPWLDEVKAKRAKKKYEWKPC